MNVNRIRWVICLVWLASLIGCGDLHAPPQRPPGPIAAQPAEVPSLEHPDQSKTERIELQVVDLNGYEAALGKLHGKVVLVDFWATWCLPCRKQFPHSLELHRRFRDRGFTVMSVSIDQLDAGETLDELKSRVLEFLTEQRAIFPNLVMPMTELAAGDPAATDVLAERLDLPGGSIPHFKLYDRQGNLVHKFFMDPDTGAGFQPSEIDTAIEKLLE
jgi:thiol-disulfide isomerase/thioredoxin